MGWENHGGGVVSRIRPKDGKRVVYIRLSFKGKEVKERIGLGDAVIEKARAIRVARLDEMERGGYKPPQTIKAERGPTFHDFVTKQFLKRHKSRGGSSYYKDVLLGAKGRSAIMHFFGAMRIKEITRKDVAEFAAQRGEEFGPSTVRKNLMLLGTVFRRAMEWEVMEQNPAAMVRKPPEPKRPPQYLDHEEWERLLQAAEDYQGGWLKPILIFAVATGMRLKEIVGLRWCDIDWTGNLLVLSNDNKTGEPRYVPMGDTLRHLLEVNLGGRFRRKDAGHVFLDHLGEVLTSRRAHNRVSQRAKAVFKLAGVGDRSFKTLRSTVGSWLAQNDASGPKIQKLLGHKDPRTTQRYMELAPKHLRGTVETLDRLVGTTGKSATRT